MFAAAAAAAVDHPAMKRSLIWPKESCWLALIYTEKMSWSWETHSVLEK